MRTEKISFDPSSNLENYNDNPLILKTIRGRNFVSLSHVIPLLTLIIQVEWNVEQKFYKHLIMLNVIRAQTLLLSKKLA